jgi:rod shape-determining protein MreB
MKHEVGSAVALEPELSGEVRGRDLVSGLPRTVKITGDELREAYAEALQGIVDTVHATLERTPPELASDLAERGIVLAGGGVLLKGFDVLLADETQLPVRLAESPLTCVAIGAGQSLEEFDALERMGGRRGRTFGRPRGTSFAR